MRTLRLLPRLLLVMSLLLATVPLVSAAPATSAEDAPRTWRLLNTFVYEGVTYGSDTLNMMEGRANGTFPTGQIVLQPDQVRTWVATPVSADPVAFDQAAWTLDFGGSSVVTGLEWIIGVHDPDTGTFTPAAGDPVVVDTTERSTFVPDVPFTLPSGGNLALRVIGGDTPSVVDTHDEQGERSPSMLRVAGGVGPEDDIQRAQDRIDRTACHHRDVIPASGCPEAWQVNRGLPDSASGQAIATAPDGGTVFVTGTITGANLQSDILTTALDAADGTTRWEHRFDGPGGPHDSPVEILVAPDGGTVYVVGGVCVVPVLAGLNCSSDYDSVVIAHDAATGDPRWIAQLGPAGDQRPHHAALSPDGSTVVVAGRTADVAGPSDAQDVWVAAVDTGSGETRWETTWTGEPDRQDYVQTVAFTPDGAVVHLAGGTSRGATGMDALILGLDAGTGELLLERTIDWAGGNDRASSVVATEDALFVSGTGLPHPDGTLDAFLLRVDRATGEDRWLEWHDGPFASDDSARFLAVSPDGQSVLVGGSEALTLTTLDVFATAHDAVNGTRRWTTRFTAPGKSTDVLRDMALSPDARHLLLAIESGWFQHHTHDYLTVVVDAANGETVLHRRHDGRGRGGDVPTGIAGSPGGDRVYVTGYTEGYAPRTARASTEMTTLAYELPNGA